MFCAPSCRWRRRGVAATHTGCRARSSEHDPDDVAGLFDDGAGSGSVVERGFAGTALLGTAAADAAAGQASSKDEPIVLAD